MMRVLPIVVLGFLAFTLGYYQGSPSRVDAMVQTASDQQNDPELERTEVDLTGTIVKARIQNHLERHACLSQIQFTTVELKTADGSKMEAMLPLQVTTLESAQKLFPTGKVESFRLSKVENIKASDGTLLYAITDAALQ